MKCAATRTEAMTEVMTEAMTGTMTELTATSRLQQVQSNLLSEMESMQARLPADVEDVSEAFERYARVITMLVRALDVLCRLEQQQKDNKPKGDPTARQALISDIEQRLARLAEQVDASTPSHQSER